MLRKVGAIGDAQPEDVLESRTFSSEAAGLEISGTLPNHGPTSISSPADIENLAAGYYPSLTNQIPSYGNEYVNSPSDIDSLSGGYYSSFTNGISDHGSATIYTPSDIDSLSSGYYSSFSNQISDRGSIDSLSAGESASSGYYDGGTVSEAQATVEVIQSGSTVQTTNASVQDGDEIEVELSIDPSSGGVQQSASASPNAEESVQRDSFTIGENPLSDLSFDTNGDYGGIAVVEVDGNDVGGDGEDDDVDYDYLPSRGSVEVSGGEKVEVYASTDTSFLTAASASASVTVAPDLPDFDVNVRTK